MELARSRLYKDIKGKKNAFTPHFPRKECMQMMYKADTLLARMEGFFLKPLAFFFTRLRQRHNNS